MEGKEGKKYAINSKATSPAGQVGAASGAGPGWRELPHPPEEPPNTWGDFSCLPLIHLPAHGGFPNFSRKWRFYFFPSFSITCFINLSAPPGLLLTS